MRATEAARASCCTELKERRAIHVSEKYQGASLSGNRGICRGASTLNAEIFSDSDRSTLKV